MAPKAFQKNDSTCAPERRRSQRYNVSWPARLTGLDSTGLQFEENGTVKDLSSGGALVFVGRHIAVGAQLDLLVKVPFGDERWMQYPAQVIRADSSQPGAGLAIRFSTFKPAFTTR